MMRKYFPLEASERLFVTDLFKLSGLVVGELFITP